jgi:cell division protein FtsB
MKKTEWTWYWLALALVCALALAYILRHDLKARYEAYRETVDTVSAQEQEVELLKQAVDEAQHRLKGMDSDPVEQEATIRRVKGLVREGEIVFRVEAEQ